MTTLPQTSTAPSMTRRLGQVFTPRPVADWMTRWACLHRPRRVLDPAAGPGVFVHAVDALAEAGDLPGSTRVDVCEIDADMLRCMAAPGHIQVRRRRADFITARFNARYDAVIANPPYVRHHAMQYDAATLQAFDRLCGRRLSRMTNLYGLFLIKIWSLLAPNGRAAVITPAEWLNADFGVAIKTYLLSENALDAILHFDHAARVFDGALTTAAITLLRRGRQPDAPIALRRVANVRSLTAIRLDSSGGVFPSDLDPRAKWTPLFGKRPLKTVDGPTLADIARCTRGIATGANDFFTLRESDRSCWGLSARDLRPCITKAQHITGDRLTPVDVRRLIADDRRIYLLNPRPRLTAAVKRYLEEGCRRGIDRRYLPSHRPTWYRPEHREPAPILVSVFARGAFRFVLNQADALNLTAYHAIYLHKPTRKRVLALFKYLCSRQALTALQRHRRIYADGLSKLEPRDVEALPIPVRLRDACLRPSNRLMID